MNQKALRKSALAHAIGATIALGLSLPAWAQEAAITRDIDVVPHYQAEGVELYLNLAPGARPESRPYLKGEDVKLKFRASKDGYIGLYNIGPTKNFTSLVPNPYYDKPMRVQAGKIYDFPADLPGRKIRFQVQGDTGIEQIYAVHAPSRQDLREALGNTRGEMTRSFLTRDVGVRRAGDPEISTTLVSFETAASANDGYRPPRVSSQAATDAQRIYVLSMGANVAPLTRTHEDARNIARFLQNKFANVEAKVIEGAYKRDFEAGMGWLKDKAGPDDLAVIFFSGHGSYIPDAGELDEADGTDEVYVTMDAEDADFPGPQHVVSDDQFADMVEDLRADQVVAIIDSCHSGGLHKNFVLQAKAKWFVKGGLGTAPLSKALTSSTRSVVPVADTGADKADGLLLLAAAREDQTAQEIPGLGGLFVTELIEAMNTVPAGSDLMTAFQTAKKEVLEKSRKQQEPVYAGETGIGKAFRF